MKIYYGTSDIKAQPCEHTAGLVSTGICRCENNDMMTIRKNGRIDWSLFYCEQGCIDFNGVIIKKGELWIYPPNAMQRYTVYAKDRSVYRYLHFNGSHVEKLLSELCIPTEQPIDHIKESLTETFQKLSTDAEANSALSRICAEYHILYLLSRLSKPSEEEKAFGVLNGVIDSMQHSFSAPYDAKTYADMLYISVSRFNHFFKESVGVSPHKYYMNIRMKNAQELLEQTDLQINVIAKICGYEDALYFAQAFKKQVGTTPSEYRKMKNNR